MNHYLLQLGRACLALFIGIAVHPACHAAEGRNSLRLPAVLGDHMVLQRNQPIRIWGWGAPGDPVLVSLGGRDGRGKVGRDGRFTVQLPALPAGGPHELWVRTPHGDQKLHDVLMGEVWLCSGQSNMEWLLQDAEGATEAIATADKWPQIRHIKVPHQASLMPQDDIAPATWQVGASATAGQFSAVGYFFARKLAQDLGVPVGLVNSSWGGTHLETWTSPQRALRDDDMAPLVRRMPRSAAGFGATYRERMTAIARHWDTRALQGPAPEPTAWASPALNDQAWPTLQVPTVWEEQGLEGFDGVIWYRRVVELKSAQAQAGARLQLGTIDDEDETYVNGQRVGGLQQWDALRDYGLPAGVLHEGSNIIAVRVTDLGGDGGFYGDPKLPKLVTSDGDVALSGPWKVQIESLLSKTAPGANDLPTLLYNGMIQPITPLALAGVIWYQGESNVPRAARYVTAFQNLILDWRQQFGQPAMPFYWVQLAAFLPLDKNTLSGSPWAELREAQRQALRLPHTGMAVTTDVGDANDIHPRNKLAVGERLARLALNRQYQHPMIDSGPVLARATHAGSAMRLRFSAVGQGLAVRGGGTELQGFAIADDRQRFVPAHAVIEPGNVVRVWSDNVNQPVAVRYGWLDNPEQGNLVNGVGLPAWPFKTDRWAWVTAKGRFGP